MSEPVTWLMPVKNGMPYLPLTLEAIANQTYKNQTIIAWDNGSSDGTVKELRRWIPGRLPGVVISHQPMPLGSSLAVMVNLAATELCARIDADDISMPTRLERQVAHILTHRDVVALGSQATLIDAEGKPTGGSWDCPSSDAEVRWLTRWQSGLIHPAVLFRKSAVLRAGNYADVESEDCELWIRLCPFGEIYSLPEVLLFYRRHAGSISGTYTDFFAGQLRSARNAAAHLFPPLNPKQALELWRLAHPRQVEQTGPVTLRHMLHFSRAAMLLARTCGKPDDYFKKTPTYQAQAYWLRRKFLQRCGLLKVADARHYLRARLRPATLER